MKTPVKTIATAESCTGGMLSALLTSRPGSSSYFKLGVVSYSNEAKMSLLNVSARVLRRFGAVSAETCCQMATHVRKRACVDIGIAITGIAGPAGAVPGKPVGTVFIALSTTKGCSCRRFLFKGSRSAVRKQSCAKALAMLERIK
jgi:nicotinamide-nucleotide amidase